MKRIIAENVSVGIRLEYDSESNKTFCIISTQTMSNHFCSDLKTALQVFDNKVDLAIQNQPEKVMSKLDLENPPERLVTSTGKEAQLIGNTGKGTHPFVVQIKRKLYPTLIYSNRDGSSTLATSTFEPSLTTLHAAQVKKTGWINLYDSQGGETHCPSARTYSTRELAIEAAETLPLIDTIHIKWEE